MPVPDMTTGLQPEEVIAERYVVKRRLGAGGMGEAWLAEDRVLHRKLVLKRLTAANADASRTSAMLSEARRSTAIESPHIAQVYDVCDHRGEWLLAMEFVPGQDLRTLLAAPLPPEKFFGLGVQLAEAIQAAHTSGILHCDIKPENIMVTEQGFVKVLDFGLARIVAVPDSGETVSIVGSGNGTFAGTPGYMAPEILREDAPTEQSDIFALGVVLYEMAGGKAPFKGKTLADSVHLTLAAEPAELDVKARGLPEDLNRILKKALNKEPERRYATMRDLAVDLKGLQQQSLSGVHFMPPVQGAPRKRAAIVTVMVTIAVVALSVGGDLLLRSRRTAHPAIGAAPVAGAPQMRLLAVLPFHVIGADANSSAYSEGLREAITANLASVALSAHMEVLAASEVRAHALTTPEEAHKELGADLVIDGSYQQFKNEAHITYELSDAAGKILSSGNLSATLTDPFSLQNHVVTGVLQMLSVSAGAVEQTPQQFGTQNPAAYDAYLRGVGYLRDFQIGDNLKKAAEGFTEATRDDPQFAAAYAGLGEAQWAEYKAETNMALIAAARASCEQAMKLGANVAEAHICQATIDDGTGEAPQAQAEFQRALELDPQSDTALNGLAQTWEEMDNPDQARHVYEQAIRTRPFYWANYYALANFLVRRADYTHAGDELEQAAQKFPENSFLARRLGVVYFLEGRLDDAARVLTQAIAERPHAMAYMDLGQVYLHQRKFSLAITNLELAAKARPNLDSIQADLGDAYAWSGAPQAQADARYREALALSRSSLAVNAHDLDALMVAAYSAAALGQRQDALQYLNAALEHAPQDAEVNYYAARVYARLGDAATAREWLQKAVAHGYSRADIETAPDLAGLGGSAPGH